MSAYLSAVLADSPQHYWRLAESGGAIAHDIGSAPFHLIAGPSGIDQLGYSGPVSDGGAGWLPSGQDFNSAGANLNALTSPFSVEVWYWCFAQPTSQRELMGWDNYSTGVGLLINAGGGIQPSVTNTFPAPSAAAPVQLWHHAVLTYDGATIRFYLDAAAQPTIAKAGPVTIARQLGIGSDPTNLGVSFEGFLAEAAIYPSALSAARVTAHHSAADQITAAPVSGAAAGLSGASTNPYFTDLEQLILQSVRKTY